MSEHWTWSVGKISLEREQILGKKMLRESTQHMDLPRFVLEHGPQEWKCHVHHVDKESVAFDASAPYISGATISRLLGASFVRGGDLKVLDCLRTLLPRHHWRPPHDATRLLLAAVPSETRPDLVHLQHLLGYQFANPKILLEAVTANAPLHRDLSDLGIRKLELLGDAVLELILLKKIFEQPRSLMSHEYGYFKDAFCSRRFLAYVCMAFRVETNAYQAASTTPVVSTTIRLADFLKFDHAPDAVQHMYDAYQVYETARPAIETAFLQGSAFPWVELSALQVPHGFSDLIESLLGALYVDSGGDLAVCEAFVSRLGILPILLETLYKQ